MKAYIGYDPNERLAAKVASSTLFETSGIVAEYLIESELRARGLYARQVDKRNGQPYDLISNAPCSTEFATSRFLVPILCQTGWALFTDCDMVFLRSVEELPELDPSKAIYVVKHPATVHDNAMHEKMCGLIQTFYQRKNWSSVMIFNCDHPANRRLSLNDVNTRPGRDLHAFYWLADDEIGELPGEWNWLVGLQPMPDDPAIAHFTLGGPWFKNWQSQQYDHIWIDARAQCDI